MYKKLLQLTFTIILSTSTLHGMDTAQTEAKQKEDATTQLHKLLKDLPANAMNNSAMLEQVKKLLQEGADPNPQSPSERPLLLSLMWKSITKNHELLALLINAKANPHIKTNQKTQSAYEWVEYMLDKGVKSGSQGYTEHEKEYAINNLQKIKQIFDAYSPAPPAPPAPMANFPSASSADSKAEASTASSRPAGKE